MEKLMVNVSVRAYAYLILLGTVAVFGVICLAKEWFTAAIMMLVLLLFLVAG